MKLLKFSLLSLTIILTFACCRRHTENTSTNAVTLNGTPSDVVSPGTGPTNSASGTNTQTMSDTTKKNADPGNYGLVISFFSPGNGIDHTTKDAYDKFLEGYKNKVEVEQYHWGREGETDYCLKLSSLSAAERTDFIAKSKAILEKSNRVHIDENASCVHKK
jgi:hypothetical protein